MVKYLVSLFCLVSFATGAQDLAFSAVNKLSGYVNSNAEEVSPLASPDGKSLYFVRLLSLDNIGGKFSGGDVWVSHYDPAKSNWGNPSNTRGVFNNKDHSAVVGMSNNGDVIYQLNTSASKKVNGIYFSKRINHSWTRPELIPIPFLGTEEFLGLYVSPDLEVMIMSMKDADSKGQEDLYVSLKNGEEWSKPLNLGPAINTAGFEISPFLSADKRRLYFASNGHPGLGDADIFYSDRHGDSWETWSVPVNLGNKINSKKFDAYLSIRDSLAYFCSNRDSEFSDLYRARIQGGADSTQLRIKEIVAEAQSLLDELNDDVVDSTATATTTLAESIIVRFDDNSIEMSRNAIGQLNKVIDFMKSHKSRVLTLVAYSAYSTGFNADSQNDDLWYKRLEVIKNFFKISSVPDLKINYELKKQDKKELSDKNGAVEVRYQ